MKILSFFIALAIVIISAYNIISFFSINEILPLLFGNKIFVATFSLVFSVGFLLIMFSYTSKTLKEKIINNYLFEYGDPIQKDKKIRELHIEIIDLNERLAKMQYDLLSPESIAARTVQIKELTETFFDSIDECNNLFRQTGEHINELVKIPKAIHPKLVDLSNGINSLVEQVNTQPEKVKDAIFNSKSLNSTNNLIDLAVILRRLEDDVEEGNLKDWEDEFVDILLEAKETIGLDNKVFFIIAWTIGRGMYNASYGKQDNGEELYKVVEKILPDIDFKNI